MTDDDSKPGARLWRFLKLFSDLLSPANLTIIVGLALVLVTGVFGGWNAADAQEESIPVFGPGDAVAADPFTVQVSEAFWASDVSPIPAGFSETTFFVVRAKISSVTSSWVQAPLIGEAITGIIPGTPLQPQSGLWSNTLVDDGSMGRPRAYRAIDLQPVRTFQPGLEQDYWLVWELPPDTPRSVQVQLEYYSHIWRASSLDGGFFWTDRALVATQDLRVPVEGRVR